MNSYLVKYRVRTPEGTEDCEEIFREKSPEDALSAYLTGCGVDPLEFRLEVDGSVVFTDPSNRQYFSEDSFWRTDFVGLHGRIHVGIEPLTEYEAVVVNAAKGGESLKYFLRSLLEVHSKNETTGEYDDVLKRLIETFK